jgi:cysteine desulfurase
MAPIYLDYNATTPMDPRVFEAMKPYFMEEFGNAGSRTHVYGQRAKAAVEKARQEVASLLNAKSEEIIFTSGATESNNLAILGLRDHGEATGRKHILASTIEHKSVLEPLEYLATKGFEVELVPVTPGGFVEVEEVKKRLRKDTLLVTVMHSNNETGVMQPVLEIGELLDGTETLFHVDGAQTFGKELEETKKLICDYYSISGHKIFGPKGVGALYIKRKTSRIKPLAGVTFGGGQEFGLRPGTLSVPHIYGLGIAAKIAGFEAANRRKLAAKIKKDFLFTFPNEQGYLNGDPNRTQSHVVNICLPGVDSEALMVALKDLIAISNGAACTTAKYSPSYVLKAMGLSEEEISCSIRFSWGPGINEIPTGAIARVVKDLRI